MRAKTLQITWHAKEKKNNGPIFSLDFHPELPLLATAGQDNEIKLWRLAEPGADYKPLASSKLANGVGSEPSIEYLFTLVGHDTSVNGVRFSPNGECLASVSDGA
jgi:WD40 repeat protein